MKRIVFLAGVACTVAACGDFDPSGSDEGGQAISVKTGSLLNQWTAWVSEEQPAGVTCGDDGLATQAQCSGSYCDNMRLFCSMPFYMTKTGTGAWTFPYISEEGGARVDCPFGQAIDGIRASGSYSDNISIHCSPITFPPGFTCGFKAFFSEEQGSTSWSWDVLNYSPSFAVAVRCSGSYCDNLSFLVCQPICLNNADCFGGFCNSSNGLCMVG
jgi:hypothetical protein